MSEMLRDVRSDDWTDASETVALFLHGFGSQEQDLAGLAAALDLGMPWASLRAPIAMGNGGAAWFTIVRPGDPDVEPVVAATDAIWSWIESNAAPGARIVPIGFSQGGLMASQLVRTRPERIAATVILGGFVLGAPQPGDASIAQSRPPVFWGRGADDRVITEAAVERTEQFLPRHSELRKRVYPGLAHGISAAEVADVHEFVTAATQAS